MLRAHVGRTALFMIAVICLGEIVRREWPAADRGLGFMIGWLCAMFWYEGDKWYREDKRSTGHPGE
jgi:hypothetical protein